MTFRGVNKLVTTIRSASLAGVLIAGLTACGGGSTAQEPQTPAPSASSATSEPAVDRPAPPVMPDQAKQPTQAGAEAFLQYWWDVYTYSYQSGDTTLLASISDLEVCSTCRDAISDVQERASRGEFTRGGGMNLDRVTLIDSSEMPAFQFNFQYQQDALTIVDRAGNVIGTFPASEQTKADTLVKWPANGWVASYFVVEGTGRS